MTRAHHLIFAATLVLGGCVAIPIPEGGHAPPIGLVIPEGEIRPGDTAEDVRSRVGEPVIDIGPQRLWIHMWTVRKGHVLWLAGGGYAALGGVEDWTVSHLVFTAFGADGTVLQSGAQPFDPSSSISKQARDWRHTVGLDDALAGPGPDRIGDRPIELFVYRPKASNCPGLTYDARVFQPSIAIDGRVVGDVAKGEYLSTALAPGVHVLRVDPYPAYRHTGQEASFFVRDLQQDSVATEVQVDAVAGRDIYVEAHVCTGDGRIVMDARTVESDGPPEAMRHLHPAW